MPENFQNIEFNISLKTVYKTAIRLDFSPVFNNVFTANILGMWEKRKIFTFTLVFLPSDPVSQHILIFEPYHDNDRTQKNDVNSLS